MGCKTNCACNLRMKNDAGNEGIRWDRSCSFYSEKIAWVIKLQSREEQVKNYPSGD